MTAIIECQSLTREFTRRGTTTRAVDGLTVRLAPGEAAGYIGANGAGKSTTIKMLLGILKPSSGQMRTHGVDPMRRRREVARRTGVVFGQRSTLWWDLPLGESFTILAAIHRIDHTRADARIAELKDSMRLGDFWDTPVRQLSLGQRMRGEIAAALVHSPSLLVLDEPTIGLDVLSKQQLREFLSREIAEHNMALLLTTHDLGDIEALCPRVLVVDQGRLRFDGTLTALRDAAGIRRVMTLDFAHPTTLPPTLQHSRVLRTEGGGVRHVVEFAHESTTAADVLGEVGAAGQVVDLSLAEPDIEQIVRDMYAS